MEVTLQYEYDALKIQEWASKLKIKLHPESWEQIKLFCWIKHQPDIEPYAFYIANDKKCNRITGQIMKHMGLKPGVSDIFVSIARNGHHGLYIELKAGKNKPTENQLHFLADMTKQGYLAVYVTGYEAAKAVIKSYMS